ncbi:hypothetical protein [Paenibacillus amylolyticus]|uniref:hypothetical protein n=1 Tax=Paenibacillus amylolyticus TaxID=1451 RepID=UPI0039AF04D4
MTDQGYLDFREFTRLDDLAAAIGTTKYNENVLGWVKEQATEALSAALNQNGSQLSQILAQASDEAIETKENVNFMLGGIQAGSSDSELKKVPLKEQLFLAEKLSHNKNLKEIAKWTGRMKVIASRKQRYKHKDAIDRNGIRQGSDIEQLLPMELGSYASPPLAKWIFYADMRKDRHFSMTPREKNISVKGPLSCVSINLVV